MLVDACGNGTRRCAGDGGPCQDANGTQLVSFDLPSSVVNDKAGNLLIADQSNQVIRRVGPDGVINTAVGQCDPNGGFSGDGASATAATLLLPLGVNVDAHGNIYVADSGNNGIRKVPAP